ncbi:hypothetical protein [Paenibacillus sp. PL2-23]|uniref:hypothetical protein n=1 Tax=Paenibacillus sp. PL2-23 TaxID=2100729 RepID=UPI0030F929E1
MKNIISSSLLLLLFLTACSHLPQAEQPTMTETGRSTPTASMTSTSQPTEPIEPSYIVEEFQGEALEIVNLINLRVQYLWEDNESEYSKLIYEDSPLQSFPLYKITKLKLTSEINIQEHKNVYQAVVSVQEYRMDGDQHNKTYVLLKSKENNGVWKIQDID